MERDLIVATVPGNCLSDYIFFLHFKAKGEKQDLLVKESYCVSDIKIPTGKIFRYKATVISKDELDTGLIELLKKQGYNRIFILINQNNFGLHEFRNVYDLVNSLESKKILVVNRSMQIKDVSSYSRFSNGRGSTSFIRQMVINIVGRIVTAAGVLRKLLNYKRKIVL